jgi:hypothetical protein
MYPEAEVGSAAQNHIMGPYSTYTNLDQVYGVDVSPIQPQL